jgi:hypothetical protein
LPNLPSSLLRLECQYNQLTFLPLLPGTLISINCNDNLLTSLPALPTSLINLSVSNNQLSSLPSLPQGLQQLSCYKNFLTTLPNLSDSLRYFSCAENLITSLPSLPTSLDFLNCGLNPLISLPTLPNSLTELHCDEDSLSNLPTLPVNLRTLICLRNQLTILPVLPNSLEQLHCSFNLLSSLPTLPNQLQYLNCSFNPLSNLPPLPQSLIDISCNFCSLTAIPDLPDFLENLDCSYNVNLYCLPKITEIITLTFTGCPINCIPNYGDVFISNPVIDTFPLCGLFNINSCDFYWNISGKAFSDSDSDCIDSINDIGLRNIQVKLYQNGILEQQVFTRHDGKYSFVIDSSGNYEVVIDSLLYPFDLICPTSGSYLDTITPTDSISFNNDFAYVCPTTYDRAIWSIVSSNFRPGNLSTINVHAGDMSAFYGLNCALGLSATITITTSSNIQYISPASGALTPTSVSGTVITYFVPDISLINPATAFAIDVVTDTTALSGDEICITASIDPVIGDINPINNELTNCFLVTASFDPNDKQVYPTGIIDTSQHWLTYTIRFQNTGTAYAENIYIFDTLDNNFDVASFELLSSSHEPFVQLIGNIVRFNFPHINLLDSNTNEPQSHGYVQYKIKLKNSLPLGTQFQNTAHIYFDYNPPVVTNTTSSTTGLINNIHSAKEISLVKVWPVPFNEYFIFESPESEGYYTVVDYLGQEISSGSITGRQTTISSSKWSSGMYHIAVRTKSGLSIGKLVKN